MMTLRQADLVRTALAHYPRGFPQQEDDPGEPVPAWQRTPEFHRWSAAWERALDWKPWAVFLEKQRAFFPEYDVREVTRPWGAACLRCCIYLREPQAEGGRVVTRVAGAVSILAPLYCVYAASQRVRPDNTATFSELTFEPSGEARSFAEQLARNIEQEFGYHPLPLEWADLPLPELRMGALDAIDEPPTLLSALLAPRAHLDNLP